jgi:hypothetical protein
MLGCEDLLPHTYRFKGWRGVRSTSILFQSALPEERPLRELTLPTPRAPEPLAFLELSQ